MTNPISKSPASRRRFIVTGLGACLASPFALSRLNANPSQWISESRKALGSKVSIRATHEDPSIAKQGIANAYHAIEKVESIMSLYRPDSQVSLLNQHGKLETPSPELLHVFRTAQDIADRSNGAFDITIQPLWSLFQKHSKTGTIPTQVDIEKTIKRVGWQKVKVTNHRIQFSSPETQITLNGIAQGFATDQARQALIDSGIQHALVDCGELSALGKNAKNQAWRVGIQHPREPDAFAALTKMKDRSLATSGDYETRFSADFRHHHIFDPHSGHSPTQIASASVVAPTALLADALSTSLMVTGVEEGLNVVRQFHDVDVLFITKDGQTVATPNFPLQA